MLHVGATHIGIMQITAPKKESLSSGFFRWWRRLRSIVIYLIGGLSSTIFFGHVLPHYFPAFPDTISRTLQHISPRPLPHISRPLLIPLHPDGCGEPDRSAAPQPGGEHSLIPPASSAVGGRVRPGERHRRGVAIKVSRAAMLQCRVKRSINPFPHFTRQSPKRMRKNR